MIDAIALIEAFVSDRSDLNELNDALTIIDKICPDTEDFEDATFALNACCAVYDTIGFLLDKDPVHIRDVIIYFIDTLYARIAKDIELTGDEIGHHPLMIDAMNYFLEETR